MKFCLAILSRSPLVRGASHIFWQFFFSRNYTDPPLGVSRDPPSASPACLPFPHWLCHQMPPHTWGRLAFYDFANAQGRDGRDKKTRSPLNSRTFRASASNLCSLGHARLHFSCGQGVLSSQEPLWASGGLWEEIPQILWEPHLLFRFKCLFPVRQAWWLWGSCWESQVVFDQYPRSD